ncbi:TonB-dependent receptor [Sphingomonas sp. A2-49]|uniref:TonB-dependent receptor n=1 Tax=Sphingomonas sp. A2-49 TaxID=1391375 RepID=UPI0021D28F18|nr:TonB-dependent receptor [Sphingomonas sp. A2-49]MCU6455716.1 TonB-dependent receptor [Sphingomonas sp. A2-49]
MAVTVYHRGAPAQDAATATADAPAGDQGADIVVTGFRRSLQSALNVKKQSSGVVDAINAQDIADFPDANLADSLQRIPGISIERDAGEGRTVTVRGLGGDFSRTRFNGLEAISATTGSTLGAGVNRGRSFDFSVFASELFNSIVVRKTQSAEVDEGSLGATIDLQTGRPFDNPGFQAAISAQGAYYDINDKVSPRLVGLVSKTWDDDRFGLLLSAAYNKRDVQEDAYSDTTLADFADVNNGFCPVVPGSQTTPVNPLVGTAPRTTLCIPEAGATPGSTPAAYNTVNQPGVFVAKLPGYGRFTNRQERLGLTGTFQAKLTDTSVITIDGAYSRFKQDRNDLATNPISLNRANGAAAAGLTAAQLSGRPNMKIRDAQVDENGYLVYGVFNDTDFSVTNSHDISTTTFYQADIKIEQKLGDRGEIDVLYGQSDSVFDNPYSRLVTFSRFDSDGFVFDARQNRNTPSLIYGFDATNPTNWQYQNGYDQIREFTAKVTNRLRNLKVDVKYDLSDDYTIKAGIAAKRFNFISARQQRIASTAAIPSLASAGLTIADVSLAPITIDTIGIPAGSSNSFIVPDIDRIMSAFGVDCYCVNQYGDFRIGSIGTGSQGDNRSVVEQDVSPYVQLDFKLPLTNGMTLRGDAGVRYAKTYQRSNGYVGIGTALEVKRDYGDWLPALNLALDLTDRLTVRAATARVMSRPSLGFLTPGGSIGTANPPFSATIGNPYLDPYRATNIDATVEWYFQPGAVLSAAYFHKTVDSFVQQLSTQTTYAAAGLPLSLLSASQDPNTATTITSYANTRGGKIDGFEIQYQQPFTFLPGPLRNLGTLLNYTHIKSNISYILTTSASGPALIAPLVNVSPNAANATLYYEDKRFSARVSLAYRDEYLRQVPLRSGLADTAGSYSTTNLDASASYKVGDHLTLTVDAINLTNQPTSFWDGQAFRDQQVYSSTGRQFFVGARYKF